MAQIITEDLLKAVSGQFDLPSIIRIDLSGRGIKKIENLEGCTNLQELILANNDISKIENLDKLPNLKVLDLSCNGIRRVENLQQFTEGLEVLKLHGNTIGVVDEITTLLSQFKNLRALYLRDFEGKRSNPCCDHPSYRIAVVRSIPNLKTLDGERLLLGKSMQEDILQTLDTKAGSVEIPPTQRWCDDSTWEDENMNQKDDINIVLQDNFGETEAILKKVIELDEKALAEIVRCGGYGGKKTKAR